MGLLDFLFGKSESPPSNREDWENDIQIYSEVSGYINKRKCKIPPYCVEFYTGKYGHKYFYNKNKTKFSFFNDEILCDTQIGEWHFDHHGYFQSYSHEYSINLTKNTYKITKETSKFGSHLSTDSSLVDILIPTLKKDYNNILGNFEIRNIQNKPHTDIKDNFIIQKYYSEKVIRGMSWRHFEEFIEKIFIYNGFVTQLTPPTNDEGKDIIAYKNGEKYFIECKHWSQDSIIGREYLQKLVGAAISYDVYNVVFIATCTFNDNAIRYAMQINFCTPMNLELWDINTILNFKVVK